MKVPRHDKLELLLRGDRVAEEFCASNTLPSMLIVKHEIDNWFVEPCAYWRRMQCHICLDLCKKPNAGWRTRNWNWPGSTADRSPFGVVLHELGHQVDYLTGENRGPYYSEYSTEVMKESGEPPITTYAANPAEWFAEIFRVFVSNPELLRELRPKAYSILSKKFYWPIKYAWREVLGNKAPDHIVANLEKKIALVNKKASNCHVN